ncbi:MAG: hypothetical protein ACP5OR_01690 [Candidatus Dormibacteria bacterium]
MHYKWILIFGTVLGLALFSSLCNSSRVAAESASLAINGGTSCGTAGLAFSWSSNAFSYGTVPLSGLSTTASVTPTLTVVDCSGTGDGWNITASGTTFTTGTGGTFATTVTIPSITSWTCSTNSTCTPPDNGSCTSPNDGITYSGSLDIPIGAAPTPNKVFGAVAGCGMGSQSVIPTVQLAIPAGALPGSYSSVWTFTLAAGP